VASTGFHPPRGSYGRMVACKAVYRILKINYVPSLKSCRLSRSRDSQSTNNQSAALVSYHAPCRLQAYHRNPIPISPGPKLLTHPSPPPCSYDYFIACKVLHSVQIKINHLNFSARLNSSNHYRLQSVTTSLSILQLSFLSFPPSRKIRLRLISG